MPHSMAAELRRLGIGKKIRALRESKDMDLDDLAARLGLSRVLLGQIESDVVPPTVATLLNLSKLLGVGMDHFFAETESTGKYEITRPNERLAVHHDNLAGTGRLAYNYESLAYRLAKKHMEPFFVEFEVTAEPGEALSHDGEEFVHVLDGEIEFRLGDDVIRLQAGDSFYFYANVPHSIRGVTGKPRALFVLYPYNA